MKRLSTSKEFTKIQHLGRVVQFTDVDFEMDDAGRYMIVKAKVTGEAGKKQKATLSGLKLHTGVAFVTLVGQSQVHLFSAPDEIELTVDLPSGIAAEDAAFRVFIDLFI